MICNSRGKQALYCMCESSLDQPVLSNKGNFLDCCVVGVLLALLCLTGSQHKQFR